MNIGSLMDSLNDAKRLLKDTEVFKDINKTRKMNLYIDKFSEAFIRVSQKDDYELIFKTALENMDYDFLLSDDSFFQFSCVVKNGNLENGSIRYSYYENPRSYPTYEEFIEEFGFTYEECGDEWLADYEQAIDEARLKNGITPIRYDYDFDLYQPIHHPVSHIHIGHNNNLRIAVSKILTPAKFVSFVLQNVYQKKWRLAHNNDAFKDLCLSAKNSCYDLRTDLFTVEEEKYLYIN